MSEIKIVWLIFIALWGLATIKKEHGIAFMFALLSGVCILLDKLDQ